MVAGWLCTAVMSAWMEGVVSVGSMGLSSRDTAAAVRGSAVVGLMLTKVTTCGDIRVAPVASVIAGGVEAVVV